MPERENDENIFTETLEWICNKLELLNIPYMITGGSAVGFWGHIRTTMDIDIVVGIQDRQTMPFLKSIENDSYINIETAKKSIHNKRMFNIIHNKTFFKVDIIPLKDDSYEIEKFNNRTRIKFRNREISVIRPEDLIISKLLWSKSAGGSEHQIKDCESIYKLNLKNLDLNYIKERVRILTLEDEFKKIT